MIIGIDIDDTIANSCDVFIKYAKIYNRENNINFKIDTSQWDLSKAFGWNKETYIDFSKKYLANIFSETNPKKNSVHIINKLKSEGNKIIIITARSNVMYEITKTWLSFHSIKYDKLIINSEKKEEACIENNVNVFIDDMYSNCKSVFEKLKIPVFLFDSKYNKNDIDMLMERVYNWDDLYFKIKNLESENKNES